MATIGEMRAKAEAARAEADAAEERLRIACQERGEADASTDRNEDSAPREAEYRLLSDEEMRRRILGYDGVAASVGFGLSVTGGETMARAPDAVMAEALAEALASAAKLDANFRENMRA